MIKNEIKKNIMIFHVPKINDTFPINEPMGCGPGYGSSGDNGSTGCGCGTSAIGLDEMLKQFFEKHGNKANVKLADYSSDKAISNTIDDLNQVLKKSNENLVVTVANLEMVLTQSAPIIAINGKIVSTKIVPSADQMANAIDGDLSALPIGKTGCC